ncbi:glycosyltransferase family 4 protein [Paenibacillus sp. 1P07SE]|uniref:glycosyltransferase family 4 protein n=1 Tax=Paenibacillus sp. 1P07SE TaxID=3132209 RepID=UPI0039A551A6
MLEKNGKCNVVFLGTSLPRECGIATFTQDLVDQFAQIQDFNTPKVIAVNNNETYDYSDQVIMQIDQHKRTDYVRAADELNRSEADLLVIQHEFGIYGGESGEYLLGLTDLLTIPYLVVFHTVLTEPSPKQRYIMTRLAAGSAKVITMAQNTVEHLTTIYQVEPARIEVVHHGVPYVATGTREQLKASYGFEDRKIISTFGFLSPGKGIEYAIEAMRGVAGHHPEALYIIWGKTHPVVKREVGEVYRNRLKDLVREYQLENNILFVDKLLTQEEVIQSLVMSDIYMTPYLGKDQAVSGTLAYAVGYGRVIVSTPYRYATEMLGGGRGLLADFRSAEGLQSSILELLEHPERMAQMEANTRALGDTMMWSEIAKRYAALIRQGIKGHKLENRSVI